MKKAHTAHPTIVINKVSRHTPVCQGGDPISPNHPTTALPSSQSKTSRNPHAPHVHDARGDFSIALR